jgi:hypothetical protein
MYLPQTSAVPSPVIDGRKSNGRHVSVSKVKLRMQRLLSARSSPPRQLVSVLHSEPLSVDAVPPLDILGIRSSQQHAVSSMLPLTLTSLHSQGLFQQNSNWTHIWRRVQALLYSRY